jgi:hypothetical protein
VIVSFVIDARRPLRNVTDQTVIRHLEAGDSALGDFVRRIVDGGDPRVSDEIRVPHACPFRLVTPIAHGKVRFFAVVAGLKRIAVVENEIRVAEEIHDDRGSRDRQQKRRLARAVIMPVPGVKRWRKEAALRPFKRLLAHPVIPNLGAAAALKHIEKLIVHVSFRFQGGPGRNLDNVHTRNATTALELNIRTAPTHAGPGLTRQFGHILDGESLKNWNAFLLHPPQIGSFLRCIYNFVHPGSSVCNES